MRSVVGTTYVPRVPAVTIRTFSYAKGVHAFLHMAFRGKPKQQYLVFSRSSINVCQ